MGNRIFQRDARCRRAEYRDAHLRQWAAAGRRAARWQPYDRRPDGPERHAVRHLAIPLYRLVPRPGLPAEARRGNQSRQGYRGFHESAGTVKGGASPLACQPLPGYPGVSLASAFWSTITRFDRAQLKPVMALRNALGVALPLAAGIALGNAPGGAMAATGALDVALSDRTDPYLHRARRMLTPAFFVALAVFAGRLC